MFEGILQRIYQIRTDEMSADEILKLIYKEEEALSCLSCYLPPNEISNALTIKSLKQWLYMNRSKRINTYSFRKTIDRLKKENEINEIFREYPVITMEQITNVKEMLMIGKMLYDKENYGIFDQIYMELFGDFDENFRKA